MMSMDRDLAECADCLCLASRRAARTLTRGYDRHLRPLGLRTTQFSILVTLTLRGPVTVGDLAEQLGSERTTLTRNLALLAAKNWVEIRTGEDARARIVSVTRKGRAVVAGALPAWRKAQRAAIAAVGEAGAATLRGLARKPMR